MSAKKNVPNLTWREVSSGHLGRWNIGPRLRALGFKPVDLWQTTGGPALSLDEWQELGFDHAVVPTLARKVKPLSANKPMELAAAREAVRALNEAAHALKSKGAEERAGRTTAPAPAVPTHITIADVLDKFMADKQAGPHPVSPNRIKSYKSSDRLVRPWIGSEVPAVVDKDLLVDRFWKWSETNGHHMALKAIQFLCAALRHCHGSAPFVGSVMPDAASYSNLRLPKAPGRLRVGLPSEMDTLLLAFDDPHRIYDELGTPAADRRLNAAPSLGDGLITMLWTCLRVEDALDIQTSHQVRLDGHDMLRFRLTKNSWREETFVTIPIMQQLQRRLPGMKARASAFRHPSDNLIIDERFGEPYIQKRRDGGTHHNRFEKQWNKYRALAGQLVPSLVGEGKNLLGQDWLAFRAQDCRDTAATRIYRATGGDLKKLSLFHGSNEKALLDLMRHYIEIDPTAAVEVGRELTEYAERHGITA